MTFRDQVSIMFYINEAHEMIPFVEGPAVDKLFTLFSQMLPLELYFMCVIY